MHPTIAKVLKDELGYCRTHLPYFVRTYVQIERKAEKEGEGASIIPFRMWPAQQDALLRIRDNRRTCALKARQIGFTWLALTYAVWRMLRPGTTVVAISKGETDAKELVRRVAVILEHIPEMIRAYEWGGPTWDSTAMKAVVEFPGDMPSTFQAFPATKGAGRSFTADVVILDEWAFQPFAEEIWTSAYPTISSNPTGQIIGLSTNKLGTFFEKIWKENDTFEKIFIPWMADPSRTQEWYEDQKKNLGDKVFAEFPATEEEAFLVIGGAFFPEIRAHIHIAEYLPRGSCRRYISIDYGLDMLAAYWHSVDAEGNDIIYREIAKSGLIVSEAAAAIRAACGSEAIDAVYAPPDLWNRNRDTGRSSAEIFGSYGLNMIQTSNDRVQGWLDLKEWLQPYERRNPHTGETELTAKMRILKDACPYLWRCLVSIQKDEHRPNDAANDPHELTHGPDSLRAFAAGRPSPFEDQPERDPLGPPEYEEQVDALFSYEGY